MADQTELHHYVYTIIGRNGDLKTLQEKLELNPLYEDSRRILSHPTVMLWTKELLTKVEFDIYINANRRKNCGADTEIFRTGVAVHLVLPLLESGYSVQQKVKEKTLERLIRF